MIIKNDDSLEIKGDGITILEDIGEIVANVYDLLVGTGIAEERAKEILHSCVDAGIRVWSEKNGK